MSLATVAVEIHEADAGGLAHRYFPWCRETSTRPPRGCRDPKRWSEALEIWRGGEPSYEPRFIHRDFHPGNVLWWRGRLGGVVDWANGCVGPAGIDVATCRWNLAEWAGTPAADEFVAAYEQLSGRPHDAYWDIANLLEDDWDRVDDPRRVERAERFLTDALRRWRDHA